MPLIPEKNRVRIEKYITGIVKNLDSRMYAVYANPEHAHILISRSPRICEEDIAERIAESTQDFINENKLSMFYFQWQNTAAAFSVSKSEIDRVCKYILNQMECHKNVSFAEEYEKFMKHQQKTIMPFKK